MYSDRKYEAELNAAAEAAGEQAAGQFGGDAEGGLEIEPPDTGEDLDIGGAAEDAAADVDINIDEPEPEADEPLLAAPARRDDRGRKYTQNSMSAQAKGKRYAPSMRAIAAHQQVP